MLVRDLSIREVALHNGLFLFLFSLGVCSCYLVFVSIPYESHTDRRGYPEIRVVELFITEKQSNEVLNDEEERQKKGEYRSTNHEAYPAWKSSWKSLEKFYFTLEKRNFTLGKALLYSRKALL